MACVMTVLMLAFMWPMYRGTALKRTVVVIAVIAGCALLLLNRNQTLVGDVAFMEAMVPHHSIAINNASKARIRDPRVRRLADGIIESQVREVAEMKLLIDDIRRNGERGATPLPPGSAAVTPSMEPAIRAAVQ